MQDKAADKALCSGGDSGFIDSNSSSGGGGSNSSSSGSGGCKQDKKRRKKKIEDACLLRSGASTTTPAADAKQDDNDDDGLHSDISLVLVQQLRKNQIQLREKQVQIEKLSTDVKDQEAVNKHQQEQLQVLKDQNWNLEVEKQDLQAQLSKSTERIKRLQTNCAAITEQLRQTMEQLEEIKAQEEENTKTLKHRHEQQRLRLVKDLKNAKKEIAQLQKHFDQLAADKKIWMSRAAVTRSSFATTTTTTKSLSRSSSRDPRQDDAEILNQEEEQEQEDKDIIDPEMAAIIERKKDALQLELDTLRQSLAHAHRTISSLRSSLQREKVEKNQVKRLLAESQEMIEQLSRATYAIVTPDNIVQQEGRRTTSLLPPPPSIRRHRRGAVALQSSSQTCLEDHEINTAQERSDDGGETDKENDSTTNSNNNNNQKRTSLQQDVPSNSLFNELKESECKKKEAAVQTSLIVAANKIPTTRQTQTELVRCADAETQYDPRDLLGGAKTDSSNTTTSSLPSPIITLSDEVKASSKLLQCYKPSVSASAPSHRDDDGDKASTPAGTASIYSSTASRPNPSLLSTTTLPKSISDTIVKSSRGSNLCVSSNSHRKSADNAVNQQVVSAITQAMVGEWMWKSIRHSYAVGIPSQHRQHRRYFWIHPYTRTLYWSKSHPGLDHNEAKSKRAFIQDVWSIPNNQHKNARLSSLTLVIRTPTRDLKLNADNIERHYQWLLALSHLLERSAADVMNNDNNSARNLAYMKTSISENLSCLSFDNNSSVWSSRVQSNCSSSYVHRLPHVPPPDQEAAAAGDDSTDPEDHIDLRCCCNGKHNIASLERKVRQ